ncbi:hypothetical protein C9381_09225 [Pantoea vagans]|uniref:Uncharacterized protein n=1 Tax=Pantoea vagans TaxID=470934 RepID=A0AAN1NU76_9GAMM|nr:hypothetical protein C9381_09225 [Pantoea vagans]
MGSCRFFPSGLTAKDLLNLYFDCASYWRINPLEVLSEDLKSLQLLIDQANRIERERKANG